PAIGDTSWTGRSADQSCQQRPVRECRDTTFLGVILTLMASVERFRAVESRVRDAFDIRAVERWVDVKHPAVRVRVQEVGDGPPVVWANGISNPGMAFAPLVSRLPGCRHLVLDLPGHALAPPFRWQGAPVGALAVGVLTGVLAGLGIERAMFVGNSLGGLFTLRRALAARQ